MNVDWVIPCRYVEVHDNLGTVVGAGIDTYWVPELPGTVQVLVAVRLTALADEIPTGPLRVRGIEKVQLHADLVILARLASALARARFRPARGVARLP